MGVILLGYRGSGKTSVGRELARALATDFVDTDEAIVHEAGKSIREIFDDEGEAGFRDRESRIVSAVIARRVGVISLGGGAVLREQNRRVIVESPGDPEYRRVYLRCDPETLYQRIYADPSTAASRPALTTMGGGIDEIRTLLAAREPLYREVATEEIDVTNLSVDEVVARLVEGSGVRGQGPG